MHFIDSMNLNKTIRFPRALPFAIDSIVVDDLKTYVSKKIFCKIPKADLLNFLSFTSFYLLLLLNLCTRKWKSLCDEKLYFLLFQGAENFVVHAISVEIEKTKFQRSARESCKESNKFIILPLVVVWTEFIGVASWYQVPMLQLSQPLIPTISASSRKHFTSFFVVELTMRFLSLCMRQRSYLLIVMGIEM